MTGAAYQRKYLICTMVSGVRVHNSGTKAGEHEQLRARILIHTKEQKELTGNGKIPFQPKSPPPPVTHLTPHKQFHLERTKYPNTGAYGDHYNSNHHTYASACDPN